MVHIINDLDFLFRVKKLAVTELVYGEKVHLKHNNKTVLWEWKIKCGICRSEVQLHLDSSLKGRILYFQAHKGHFMQYLFTLLLIISTCQGHLYRTRKMNESRQHNIWYTKLISVVFYILMRIAVQEWTSYLKIALQFNNYFDPRSMRCYFEVSTSLLDHFKTCQSKAKKTPHAKATNSPQSVELTAKAIRGGNIKQGKSSTDCWFRCRCFRYRGHNSMVKYKRMLIVPFHWWNLGWKLVISHVKQKSITRS